MTRAQHAVMTAGEGIDWRQSPAYVSARRENDEMASRLAAKERADSAFSPPSFTTHHFWLAPTSTTSWRHKDSSPDRSCRLFWGLLNESFRNRCLSRFKNRFAKTQHTCCAVIAKANTRDLMKACHVSIAKPSPRGAGKNTRLTSRTVQEQRRSQRLRQHLAEATDCQSQVVLRVGERDADVAIAVLSESGARE